MKQMRYITSIVVMLLMISCEKVTNDSTSIFENQIFAGTIKDYDTLYVLDKEIFLIDSCIDDEGFPGFNDSDSIDILNDGVFDLRFVNDRFRYVNTENGSFCPRTFFIEILSDIEIGYNQYYFDIGLPIELNDTIDENLFWTNKVKQTLFSGPPGDGWEWFEDSKDFLAFRLFDSADTLYGWIKINDLESINEYGINK